MPQGQAGISQRKKRPRPMRVKHVPVRTCISCRESGAKRGLTRLVRTTEQFVEVDPTGKQNGRGAYLCDTAECWKRALDHGGLARALNVTLTTANLQSLREFAASHVGSDTGNFDAAHSKEHAS